MLLYRMNTCEGHVWLKYSTLQYVGAWLNLFQQLSMASTMKIILCANLKLLGWASIGYKGLSYQETH